MESTEGENMRSVSTTWVWKRVKIGRPPEAMTRSASALHLSHLARRDPRKPLQITIKYRGGPEAWYEVQARGATVRVAGHTALHDLMVKINAGGERRRETDPS